MSAHMNVLASLLQFERLGLIFHKSAMADDLTVIEAKKQMESVSIPTRFFDVFDLGKLNAGKALFSHSFKQDPTPGFGLSRLSDEYELTIEGYFLDKYFSSKVSNEFMEEALRRIEIAVKSQLNGTYQGVSKRDGFYISDIQHGDSGNTANWREVHVETMFILRVVERWRIQEEARLYQELPLPKFSDPASYTKLQTGIQDVVTNGGFLSVSCSPNYLKEVDRPLYQAYLKTFFDERDRRMLKILKDAFEQDKIVRETDPHAPLTHLVTLDSYEKEIHRRRQYLYAKITIAAFAAFFFTSVWGLLLKTQY